MWRVGLPGYGHDLAQGYFDQGVEFVAIAGDAWLMARQMDGMIVALR